MSFVVSGSNERNCGSHHSSSLGQKMIDGRSGTIRPRTTEGTSARLLSEAMISTCSQQICCLSSKGHPALREHSCFQHLFPASPNPNHDQPARVLMHQLRDGFA